jgi:arginine decarboxylase
MNHNLFTKPSEYTIIINDADYEIINSVESKSILEILNSIGYNKVEILKKLEIDILKSDFITEKEKSDTLLKLKTFLEQNGYLRTTN